MKKESRSLKREMQELRLWIETRWEELDKAAKRQIKAGLEHRLLCGLSRQKQKMVRDVLVLVK